MLGKRRRSRRSFEERWKLATCGNARGTGDWMIAKDYSSFEDSEETCHLLQLILILCSLITVKSYILKKL